MVVVAVAAAVVVVVVGRGGVGWLGMVGLWKSGLFGRHASIRDNITRSFDINRVVPNTNPNQPHHPIQHHPNQPMNLTCH